MADKKIFGFPKNVFYLSLASFLNDVGGESIKKTIPLLLTNILGAPIAVVGLVEGVSDSISTIIQPIFGIWSDRMKSRKWFVLTGYGFGLISKMLLFIAYSWPMVLGIRFLDRAGRGIGNSPRDALIAQSTPDDARGKAFGFNRAMDNAGAVIGLMLMAAVVYYLQQNSITLTRITYNFLLFFAVIPITLVLLIVAFFVHDVRKHIPEHQTSKVDAATLPKKFNRFLILSFIFSVGNSSDGFLLLKTQMTNMPAYGLFIMLAFFSLITSLSSYPAGRLSDSLGRSRVLFIGWCMYMLVYLGFARVTLAWQAVGFYGLYSIYYGFTDGVSRAFVADLVPQERRGTAFGVFNFVTGITLLPASILAGFLWQAVGPSVPFYIGSITAGIAAVGLLFL